MSTEQPKDPNQAAPQPGGEISQDSKTMGMLAHILGILSSWIGPLIIWLIKKDTDHFVSENAKEALNFQITLFIGYFVSGILMCVLIGYLTFLAVWVCAIVFGILGGMAANKGEYYRYPFNIRMIK
jgi:uncharacterized Tic20 family protein